MMSFAKTVPQMRARIKYLTHRTSPAWEKLQPGDVVQAVTALPRVGDGKWEKLHRIRATAVERLVCLGDITEHEVELEGFPGKSPEWFIRYYCNPRSPDPGILCTKIWFEHLGGLHEDRAAEPFVGSYVNREYHFAQAWEEKTERYSMAGHMLKEWDKDGEFCPLLGISHPYNLPMGPRTGKDDAVAAGIIQWLGSNVGWCFLQEALKRFGKEIVNKSDRLLARNEVERLRRLLEQHGIDPSEMPTRGPR